jgi:hypothetical protein
LSSWFTNWLFDQTAKENLKGGVKDYARANRAVCEGEEVFEERHA